MINEIYNDCIERMQKSIQSLEVSFSKVRAGRAHPSLLEQVMVDYYGSPTPITQIANVTAEDARTLKITPWEKAMVGKIEKAVLKSDLGLNPTTVGEVIRLPLPALTEERRRELVKVVKEHAETAKISVRNIRRDANADIKELQKEKEISEDEAKRAEDKIQSATNEMIEKITNILANKEDALMAI